MASRALSRFYPLPIILLLAGCVSPQKQPELNQLHSEVSKLNNEMHQLTRQAASLEQQNSLNGHSAQGAWLLPATKTAVLLHSQAGELRLSLSDIDGEANGTRAVLHIGATSGKPVPAFDAQIEWGELDSATGKPLSAQSQPIRVTPPLLPQSDVTVSLHLTTIAPDQLGYVRIHNIVVQTPSAP